jgi:hypothetical protein
MPYDLINGSSYIMFIVSLKGLSKEFRTPKKYQVRIKTSAKDRDSHSKDSGFVNIASETFQYNFSYPLLHSLSSTGSLVLDVTVTMQFAKGVTPHSTFKNPMKIYKQIAVNNGKMLENPQFSDFKFFVKARIPRIYFKSLKFIAIFSPLQVRCLQNCSLLECWKLAIANAPSKTLN